MAMKISSNAYQSALVRFLGFIMSSIARLVVVNEGTYAWMLFIPVQVELVSQLLYNIPTQAIDTHPAAVHPLLARDIKERLQIFVCQEMLFNPTLGEVYNSDLTFLRENLSELVSD